MTPQPEIDPDHFLADLDALARIGADPESGGVNRLAFTPEDRAGRDFVAGLLQELDLAPRYDAVGNLFALRGEPGPGCVLAGSHTDSVGSAGRFDGSLGVLAAVAALRAMHVAGVWTKRPVGLVSFVNEEGVRFMPDMLGSLFVRGDRSIEEIRGIRSTDGETIGDALVRTGMAGQHDLRGLDVRAFLELHIEQGPLLYDRRLDIGVVTGVQGLRWLRCTLSGAANHAGTTPMEVRRDAGLVAARITVELRRLTLEIPGTRATVGHVRHTPGLVNVIPGRAEMTVDLRHPDPATLDRAWRLMRERIPEWAAEEGVEASLEDLAHAAPVTFDPDVVEAVDRAAALRGYSRLRLVSGAGHDAQIMSSVWPTAMIFVPSRDGISHSPAEYSSPEACVAGARVLLDALLALADT